MKGNWRVAPGVSTREDSGSLILLSPAGRYYGLDDIGRLLWCGLEQDELESTIAQIHRHYRVPLSVVREDADRLFRELRKAGLIQDAP